jgi:hypothetical protein
LGYHVIFWGDFLVKLLDWNPNLLRQPSTTKRHRTLAKALEFETRMHTWLEATDNGSESGWQTEQDSPNLPPEGVEIWTGGEKQAEFEAGLSSCGLLPWWDEPCPLQEWEAKTVMSDWKGKQPTEQGAALEEQEWEAKTVISDWQDKWQTEQGAALEEEEWEAKTVISDWQGKWQTEQETALEEALSGS